MACYNEIVFKEAAEVIKIERPGAGDEARRRGPFMGDIPYPERSGLFLYLNTNKKGITLDVKIPTGKGIFRGLVEWADILVEDNSPKEMKELGLDYETLKGINPQLIVTSITPFGQTGPYSEYKAYNLNLSHGAGGGYLTPGFSPNLGREPLKARGLMDDFFCGLSAAVATLGALYARWAIGVGQHVDVSKQEALINIDRGELLQYPYYRMIPTRAGAFGGSSSRRCKDGYVELMAVEDRQWQAFVELLGNPEWTRITDFAQVWAGPYITLLLGFMGAEVIKIESMKRLDQSRTYSLTLRRFFSGDRSIPYL